MSLIAEILSSCYLWRQTSILLKIAPSHSNLWALEFSSFVSDFFKGGVGGINLNKGWRLIEWRVNESSQ